MNLFENEIILEDINKLDKLVNFNIVSLSEMEVDGNKEVCVVNMTEQTGSKNIKEIILMPHLEGDSDIQVFSNGIDVSTIEKLGHFTIKHLYRQMSKGGLKRFNAFKEKCDDISMLEYEFFLLSKPLL